MPNTQAGIGAQRYTKFLNSDAGAPFRTYKQWYTNHLNPDKTSSKTPVVTHKFGTSGHNYREAIQAFKSGQKLDLSGASKAQKNELNKRYLQSLSQKPTNFKSNTTTSADLLKNIGSVSSTTTDGRNLIYSSMPTMRQ